MDKHRIALLGSSFGGYVVPRAAAFEHRLAGLVLDPGVHDAFVSWTGSLPTQLLRWLRQGDREAFNRYWAQAQPYLPAATRFYLAKRAEIYGRVDFYDQMRLAGKFVLPASLARRIDAPAVITQPQLEQFFPGQSKQLHAWLGVKSSLLDFTVAQGAQYHCEPLAPTLRNDAVLDWLESNIRPTK